MNNTHGINKDKKELFTITLVNGNNIGFNAARAYIPNAQRWVLITIFKEYLPLFGPIITQQNRLKLTDGCSRKYLSFISNSGRGSLFPSSCLGLCYFYFVIQG